MWIRRQQRRCEGNIIISCIKASTSKSRLFMEPDYGDLVMMCGWSRALGALLLVGGWLAGVSNQGWCSGG